MTISTGRRMRVLGAGAVTSVGHSLPATALAIRAGIDNFHETHFYDRRGNPISGAAMELFGPLTPNSPRVGGAKKLGTALAWAVEECVRNAQVRLPLPSSVPLVFLGDDARPAPLVEAAELCRQSCASLFQGSNSLQIHTYMAGEASCVDALEAARMYLAQGAPYVLVAAADSWLRVPDIQHGLDHERLLASESGFGFVPGEGSAALLLVPVMNSAQMGDVTIAGIGRGVEPAPLLSDEPCYGRGLASALRAALVEAGWQPHEVNYRLSDSAGESYFAEELAYAWARLLRKAQPQGNRYLHPASYLGHIGCAFGPMMLALVWQFARTGHLPGPKSLVQLSSGRDLRGGIAVLAGVS